MKLTKRVRLKSFAYIGPYRYFITICTHGKNPLFDNRDLISWLTDILREKSISHGFAVWAYCFMPDHLHILAEGKGDVSDMRKFVLSYKQHTGFHYKKRKGSPLWQNNYYEHILRKKEITPTIASYIWDNPVRKGLVENFFEYEFLGSFEFDMAQM